MFQKMYSYFWEMCLNRAIWSFSSLSLSNCSLQTLHFFLCIKRCRSKHRTLKNRIGHSGHFTINPHPPPFPLLIMFLWWTPLSCLINSFLLPNLLSHNEQPKSFIQWVSCASRNIFLLKDCPQRKQLKRSSIWLLEWPCNRPMLMNFLPHVWQTKNSSVSTSSFTSTLISSLALKTDSPFMCLKYHYLTEWKVIHNWG